MTVYLGTYLGTQLGTNLSGSDQLAPIRQRFRSLFNAVAGDFWFDADQATAAAATDYIDPTHLLSVVTGTLAAPAADALFSTNCKTLAYTGTQGATGSRSAASYVKYLNGSGCTRVDVFATTSLVATQIFSSVGASATASAVQGAIPTSGLPILQLTNDAGGAVVSNTAGPALAVNTPTWMAYTQISTSWAKYVKTTVAASGTSPAPGTVATLPLRIGSQSGGVHPASMKWRGSYGWGRVLSASELAIAAAFFTADAGT